jgi:hypothetical protein
MTQEIKKTILSMLGNGANNGRISLKFPGIRKAQIDQIRKESAKGTPETLNKIKRDPLLTLYKAGEIDLNELYAAEYIRYAFTLITADVVMRVMSFEGFVDLFGGKPTESESQLQSRVQKQYADWFDECTKKMIKVGPIIHLLTEPVSLRETDAYYRYRNGTSRKYAVRGLKLYVEMFNPNKGIDV